MRGQAALDLAPGELAVGVAVEVEGDVEVAQGDVPAHVEPARRGVDLQVGVARLVRARAGRHARQAPRDERARNARASARAPAPRQSSASMRRSCRPIDAFRRRASSIASAAARARGLGEHEQVERLALLRDVAARQLERARRRVLDDEREHRLLAAVEDARFRALVGQGDALAHLGDVALAARRLGARAGDRQAQQDGVGARLVLQHLERLGRPALGDQEIGIGDRGVGVGAEAKDVAIGGIGGGGAAVALLELGKRGRQPAARARRQLRVGQHRLEALARHADVAAQGGVLGQAGAPNADRGAGGGDLPARRVVGIGVAALHAQHRRQRQPGLRLALAARPRQQLAQARDRGVELVQVLLQASRASAARRRGRRGLGPGAQRRQRQAGEARIAELARLVEVALRDRERQRRRRRAAPPGACAARGPRRGCRPWPAAPRRPRRRGSA